MALIISSAPSTFQRIVPRASGSGGDDHCLADGTSRYEIAPAFLQPEKACELLPRPATLDQFTTGKIDLGPGQRYGYGFGDATLNGHRIVGQSGGFPGISANLDMFWNDGWVVVVMSNMDAGAMALVKKARELIATER